MAEKIEAESRALIVREAAEVLGEWLQGAKLLEKRIWQLRMPELESIVDVAVSAFIVAQSREESRRDSLPAPPPSAFVD